MILSNGTIYKINGSYFRYNLKYPETYVTLPTREDLGTSQNLIFFCFVVYRLLKLSSLHFCTAGIMIWASSSPVLSSTSESIDIISVGPATGKAVDTPWNDVNYSSEWQSLK